MKLILLYNRFEFDIFKVYQFVLAYSKEDKLRKMRYCQFVINVKLVSLQSIDLKNFDYEERAKYY